MSGLWINSLIRSVSQPVRLRVSQAVGQSVTVGRFVSQIEKQAVKQEKNKRKEATYMYKAKKEEKEKNKW